MTSNEAQPTDYRSRFKELQEVDDKKDLLIEVSMITCLNFIFVNILIRSCLLVLRLSQLKRMKSYPIWRLNGRLADVCIVFVICSQTDSDSPC